jgi:Inner membrane protein YgaP-like, transmembrane domain
MYLENGRDIARGILLLIFGAIALWGNFCTGLVLVGFMGVMILQSAFTNWCPADLILRPMGLKGKLESKG